MPPFIYTKSFGKHTDEERKFLSALVPIYLQKGKNLFQAWHNIQRMF